MKHFFTLLAFIASFNTLASSTIRTKSGQTCTQSDFQPYSVSAGVVDGESENSSFGVVGNNNYWDRENRDQRVELRFTYKFGGSKALDCSRLYNLELQEKEAEIALMREKVRRLEKIGKINWTSNEEG